MTCTVILTCELHWLAELLDRVADTTPAESKAFSCLEPTFRVEAKHSEAFASIHVLLGFRFLPPRSPNDEITITFEPTTEALARFISDIRRDRRRFPIRAVETSGPAQRWIASTR